MLARTNLLKTITGKAVIGLTVVTMGVGAAAAADVPTPTDQDAPAESSAEQEQSSEEEVSPVEQPREMPDWRTIKNEGRAAWHALRDEKRAEWREAKDTWVEMCRRVDGGETETAEGDTAETGDDGADADGLSDECRALKVELKELHRTLKAEWKAARDEAKAEWKAAKEQAPDGFGWRHPPYEYEGRLMPIDILWGHNGLRSAIDADAPVEEAFAEVGKECVEFAVSARPFLLYGG